MTESKVESFGFLPVRRNAGRKLNGLDFKLCIKISQKKIARRRICQQIFEEAAIREQLCPSGLATANKSTNFNQKEKKGANMLSHEMFPSRL